MSKDVAGGSKRFYLDVSPLFEVFHTGIAKVTKELARYALSRDDVLFFSNDLIFDRELVAASVRSSSGIPLYMTSGSPVSLRSAFDAHDINIGLFPNLVTVEYFDVTVQIVHDLIYLALPDAHTTETRSLYLSNLLYSSSFVDRFLCVSEFTKSDLLKYAEVPESKVFTIGLGCDEDQEYRKYGNERFGDGFVLVLGTIEPRKGTIEFLEVLSNNTNLLNEYRVIFAGKDGWLVRFEDFIKKFGLDPYVNNGRIVRLDYVDECAKQFLLSNAALVVFPSIYEGFGLPVSEASFFCTPVLASNASSIPEVSFGDINYFSPNIYGSLEREFNKVIRLISDGGSKKDFSGKKRWLWRDYAQEVFNMASGVSFIG